jgi:hypothetical protein
MGEGGEGGRGAREEARAQSFARRVLGRGGQEKEEKEGEVHRRRARRRRLGQTDLQRREHGFAEVGTRICMEEGTWICTGGGHTVLHQRRAHGQRKWFEFFLLYLECAC